MPPTKPRLADLHPVPLTIYAAYVVLSICYLTDRTEASALTEQSGGYAWVWMLALLASSSLALAGWLTLIRRRLLGLYLESVGAGVLGIEIGVYVASVYMDRQWGPLATLLVFGAISLGVLARSVQAMIQRGQAVEIVVAQAERNAR